VAENSTCNDVSQESRIESLPRRSGDL